MDHSVHLREERLNAISHGIGAALSAFGLVLLLQRAVIFEDFAYTFSCAVYGVSFCLVFLSSTFLHCSRSPKWCQRFEVMDHAAIFIAIAGSYTPFLMITLEGNLGYSLLLLIWALALCAVRCIRFIIRRFIPWGLLTYLVMAGFMGAFIIPLQARLPGEAIVWVLAGVLMYIVGLLFFLWRRLRYHHAIWHMFVLAGSGSHFIAVYSYVMPALL